MGSSTEAITIVLPIPPVAVRPNGRAQWRAKAKAVKAMRDRAYAYTLVELCGDTPPGWTSASVLIDWYHSTKRLMDRDNIIASCKAYIDGIADAGLIADDVGVAYEPVGRFVDPKHPRVEITITPTETITPTGER